MTIFSFLLPAGVLPDARLLLWTRALRAFGDGYVSLLLPFYLTLLGFDALQVGMIITATLLGSGAMTLGVGLIAHRYRSRSLLLAVSLLMMATGIAIVNVTDFWPLLVVAFIGTLNPSTGDVSAFLPLEHALLARVTGAPSRTALFARYSWIGAFVGAIGAQAAGLPDLLAAAHGVTVKAAMQGMFLLYAVFGLACFALYRRLSPA
ncbi:MAG: MFS transporter, partial [Betaproteobacteria bacterium]|nr:MFS transporter [Betaproteobacteria bacterium]